MKITAQQLRRIIKEEIARANALDEGIFGRIGKLAGAAFTGKIDGKKVPEGVAKSTWLTILEEAEKGASSPEAKEFAKLQQQVEGTTINSVEELVEIIKHKYIQEMTSHAKKGGKGIQDFKSWLRKIHNQLKNEFEEDRDRSAKWGRARDDKERAAQQRSREEYEFHRNARENDPERKRKIQSIKDEIDSIQQQMSDEQSSTRNRVSGGYAADRDRRNKRIEQLQQELNRLERGG